VKGAAASAADLSPIEASGFLALGLWFVGHIVVVFGVKKDNGFFDDNLLGHSQAKLVLKQAEPEVTENGSIFTKKTLSSPVICAYNNAEKK
jgi:hypothetical protein